MHRSLPWFGLAAAVIALDQLTKWWALVTLVPHRPVEVLPFFNLTLVFNRGAAFSFLAGAGGWQKLFFIGLALVISAILAVWLARSAWRQRWLAAGIALILGGAIGNVIDRIRYGHVVDFLDLHAAGWHWPAFNVADSAITVGAIMLLLVSLHHEPDQTT
jgi:signal peptidase II